MQIRLGDCCRPRGDSRRLFGHSSCHSSSPSVGPNYIYLLLTIFVGYKMEQSCLRVGGPAYYSPGSSFNDLIYLGLGQMFDCVGFDFHDKLSDG